MSLHTLSKTSLMIISALMLAACSSSGDTGSLLSGSISNQTSTNNNGGANTNNNGGNNANTPSPVNTANNTQMQTTQAHQNFGKSFGNYQTSDYNYTLTVDGKAQATSLTDGLKTGINNVAVKQAAVNKTDSKKTATVEGKALAYKQANSVVVGMVNSSTQTAGGLRVTSLSLGAAKFENDNITLKGSTTETLPTAGSFTYKGDAFSSTKSTGKLEYSVDFSKQTGSGSITGIDAQAIALKEGKIGNITHTNKFDNTTLSGKGITSSTSREGETYTLGFFGKNADEIAGVVSKDGKDVIGFGGKK